MLERDRQDMARFLKDYNDDTADDMYQVNRQVCWWMI